MKSAHTEQKGVDKGFIIGSYCSYFVHRKKQKTLSLPIKILQRNKIHLRKYNVTTNVSCKIKSLKTMFVTLCGPVNILGSFRSFVSPGQQNSLGGGVFSVVTVRHNKP
jgi:hypothetical protein